MKKLTLQTSPVTLSECFDNYITTCTVRNLSEKTIQIRKVYFSILQQYLDDKDFPASEVTPATVDGFVLYLQKRGCSDVRETF